MSAPAPRMIIVFGVAGSGKTTFLHALRDRQPRAGGLFWWRRRRLETAAVRKLKGDDQRFGLTSLFREWQQGSFDLAFHVDCFANDPVDFVRDWLAAAKESSGGDEERAAALARRLEVYITVAPPATILERARLRRKPATWNGWQRVHESSEIHRRLITELKARGLSFSFVDGSGRGDGPACFPASMEHRFWEIEGRRDGVRPAGCSPE